MSDEEIHELWKWCETKHESEDADDDAGKYRALAAALFDLTAARATVTRTRKVCDKLALRYAVGVDDFALATRLAADAVRAAMEATQHGA